MKSSLKFSLFCVFFWVIVNPTFAKEARVTSPNGKIAISLNDADGIKLQLTYEASAMLNPSPISLDLEGKKPATRINKVKNLAQQREVTVSPFYRQKSFEFISKRAQVILDNGVTVELLACDQGAAYRFVTKEKGEIKINNEIADFIIPADNECWLPYSTNNEHPMAMGFQNVYDRTPISKSKDKYAFLPITVAYPDGLKLTLAESDLQAYPGLWIKADTIGLALKGAFAPYPSKTDYYKWRRQKYVTATEDFIAKTCGTRAFPWRIFAITANDIEMPVNNMVYALAAPNRIGDTQWIKPGKVAWDWWNDWGLKNVPFKAGINMDTYKYYIDFASENGIEYVVLDEGWYDSQKGNMLEVIPELDLPALVKYASDRNVGIVLWTVFNILDDNLEEICATYAKMGIKGMKVDFLDRDDQTAVEMTYRVAEACAKHKLFLDFHGYFKPTGLNRTYPNILNFEGVFGMEEVKWTDLAKNMPEYDVTFPYIRVLAGPVDYTPGAMRNATKKDWRAVYYNPMSMGTRCHQLATYVVYDSPFTMLCDAPTNYKGEEESVEFMVGVPNTIDETLVLQGEIGKYIVTARRQDKSWWIGGLTNWDERDLTINLSFLADGQYDACLYTDGPNANKNATDYQLSRPTLTNKDSLRVHLASGGGFAVKLSPR